jgi:hypothetical protein
VRFEQIMFFCPCTSHFHGHVALASR